MDAQTACLTATAQVWLGGTNFETQALPLPALQGSDAIVRVDLATICGSDIHTVSGRRSGACPSILGHEAVGTLVEIGPEGIQDATGRELSVGDRVIWSVTVSCGTCDRCEVGMSAKCRTLLKTGHEALNGSWGLSGGYSSHIYLPAGITLVSVPGTLPDAVAAPAACATATVMAVVEAAGSLLGQRVLVSGAGMLGLVASAVAAHHKAASVTVSDVNPQRLELARKFGASQTRRADQVTHAAAYDIALDLSGAQPALEAALSSLDIGGRLVLAGSVAPGPALTVDPERMVRSLLSLSGVHNYEPRHLQQAMDFLVATTAKYPWQSLVSPPRPAAELPSLMHPPTGNFLRYSIAFDAR